MALANTIETRSSPIRIISQPRSLLTVDSRRLTAKFKFMLIFIKNSDTIKKLCECDSLFWT